MRRLLLLGLLLGLCLCELACGPEKQGPPPTVRARPRLPRPGEVEGPPPGPP